MPPDPTMQGAEVELTALGNGQAPVAPPVQPEAAPAGKQNIIQMPASAMAKIRGDERRKGQFALAKKLGFASVEAMEIAFIQRKTAPPPAAPKPAAPTAASPAAPSTLSRKDQQRIEELEAKNKRLSRDKIREERRRRDLQTKLDYTSAESKLRVIALRCGVLEEHADFVLFKLRERVQGMTPGQITKLNEVEFFNSLKPRFGYLFSEVRTAPSTGASTAANAGGKADVPSQGGAKPPGTVEATTAGAGGTKVDAMKLSDGDWKQMLRDQGINL